MSSSVGQGFSKVVLSLGLLSAAIIGVTGCGGEPQGSAAGPGRVAVVDMGQIAMAAGLETRMGQMLQEAQAQEQAQLQALQKQLGLDPEKPPTAEQAQSAAYQQARLQMSQAISQAQQRLQAIELNELEQFRNMVRPIALRVANAQGCTIVMELRDGMLSVDPASNITDEVITELPLTSRGSQNNQGANPQPPASQTGPGATSQPGFPQAGQLPMMPGSQPPAQPSPSSPPASGTGMGTTGYLSEQGLPSPQPATSDTR